MYDVKNSIGWCVLAHMRLATKESWHDFAVKLQEVGYESLAIDLRGHGESEGGPISYLDFSDEENKKSILDLEAAVDFLIKERKAKAGNTILIGASIGANLALQYIKEHQEFKKAVLFSPGLNYRGIETEPLIKNLKAGQNVFFISAKDDRVVNNKAEMNQIFYDLTPVGIEKKIEIYETGGHGTDIFKSHPESINMVMNFLK